MSTIESEQLLQIYAKEGSEQAFRELVDRHVGLVYSTALRKLNGDSHLAEDVVQTVFCDLARKGTGAAAIKMLGGWLHQHTCFTTANLIRGEMRRRNREREAMEMNTLENEPDNEWQQLAPVLDDAMSDLEAVDRHAIVLRFFERRNFQAIGAALGVSEDAAQKRVARAVDKLRGLLDRRGTVLTGAVLATVLGRETLQAAPEGLAGRVAGPALAAASTMSGLMLLMLRIMASTKIKLALATLLVMGLALVPWGRLQQRNAAKTAFAKAVVPQTFKRASAEAAELGDLKAQLQAVLPSNPSHGLHLTSVMKETGKPAGNVEIWGWGSGTSLTKLAETDEEGQCDIPLATGARKLELYTRKEGLADVHLLWNGEVGEKIPSSYTTRLIGATAISGYVVGPEDEPVEGALVGFNHDDDPDSPAQPENHEFCWIQVKTDSQGRWEINRIAADMIHRVYGSARHTNYVDTYLFSANGNREMEKQLRNGTYTFHLGKPVTLHGLVVDSSGKPVVGARVFAGRLHNSELHETRSLGDGTFVLDACRPGKNLLTASAGGFAATTLELDFGGSAELTKLVLKRGRTLRMRIEDASGHPIARAHVWVNTMNNPISESNVLVQAEFTPNSGEDGRVVWENAPEAKSQFDIAANGYMRTTVVIEADGEEHVVTLPPALVVFGQVLDATTKQPIPNFRLICGCPGTVFDAQSGELKISEEEAQANWSSIGRFTGYFHDGQFRHALEEGTIVGNTNYIFKIDAEGYSPFVSRVVHAEEGEVCLDVELQATSSQVVRVVFLDGRPAVGADVGLVSAGARLQLIPGGFSRENRHRQGCLLRTDESGSFHMKKDETVSKIIVAHPEGYAEVTPSAVAARALIVLQPWGRIEGTWLSTNVPAPKRDLVLQFADQEPHTIGFDGAYRVETDGQARFVWGQVPPGRLKLVQLVPAKISPGGFGWIDAVLPNEVVVRPGETAAVKVGALRPGVEQ